MVLFFDALFNNLEGIINSLASEMDLQKPNWF